MTSPGPGTGARPAPVTAGRALAWSLANTMVGKVGTVAIGVVLARILGPAEFGTYAVAFVALIALLSFNELGVSLAIVRWPGHPMVIAPTVNTISVTTSLLLTGAALVAAPWFAAAMGGPEATGVIRLLSICVLINGLVATPAAAMQRFFRQDQRMVADQVNVWVGAVVSIGLALLGFGAWSLALGRLSGAGLSALLLLHYSPLPYRFGLDPRHARALLAFGLPLAGASVIVFLVGFVDQVVVGPMLGPTLLGYYVLAVNLAGWPVALFSQPLRGVAPAMFSRIQHDPERMRADLPLVLRPLALAAVPLCVLMAVAAPQIVQVVYGDAWIPAGEVLRWLALGAALRIFGELAYDYLVVLQRSRAILYLQVVTLAVLVPAVWVGVWRSGVSGAAVALLVVSGTVTVPLYLRELRRVGVDLRSLARAVRPALLVSTGVAVGCWGAVRQLEGGFVLLAGCGLGVAAVVAAQLWRHRSDLSVLRTPAEHPAEHPVAMAPAASSPVSSARPAEGSV